MKTLKNLILICGSIVLLQGCQGESKSPVDSVKDQDMTDEFANTVGDANFEGLRFLPNRRYTEKTATYTNFETERKNADGKYETIKVSLGCNLHLEGDYSVTKKSWHKGQIYVLRQSVTKSYSDTERPIMSYHAQNIPYTEQPKDEDLQKDPVLLQKCAAAVAIMGSPGVKREEVSVREFTADYIRWGRYNYEEGSSEDLRYNYAIANGKTLDVTDRVLKILDGDWNAKYTKTGALQISAKNRSLYIEFQESYSSCVSVLATTIEKAVVDGKGEFSLLVKPAKVAPKKDQPPLSANCTTNGLEAQKIAIELWSSNTVRLSLTDSLYFYFEKPKPQ